jgi:hypothetical protein
MSQAAVPDYFIATPDHAARAIREAGEENMGLLLDVFPTLSVGLDVQQEIAKHAALLAHVHIPDFPGRHEPGSATIDFNAIELALRRRTTTASWAASTPRSARPKPSWAGCAARPSRPLAEAIPYPGAYQRIAELTFADMDALQAGLGSEEGQAAVNDIPNFATGGVTIFFAEID